MNDTAQTLIRTVLKVGGGVLVTKGYADSSGVETISAALMIVIGIIWGVMHKKPAA